MISNILNFFKKPGDRTKQYLKDRLKPATATLVTGAAFDVTRNKTDLIIENTILRQQVIVFNRQIKRPQFKQSDRFRLIFLSRFTQYWQQSLHIVQPDTLLRWHRDLFKQYWRRKSKGRSENRALLSKPLISSDRYVGVGPTTSETNGQGLCHLLRQRPPTSRD